MNTGQRKCRSASGYYGVRKKINIKKCPYQARIYSGNRELHIGYYATAYEAAKAYDARSIELYGSRAKLNFPVTIVQVGLAS